MDRESKDAATRQEDGNDSGEKVQAVPAKKRGLAEAQREADEFKGPVSEFISETAKSYPQVALRAVSPNYRLHAGQWDPGVTVDLSGPENAVRAFLAHAGLVLKPTSLQLIQPVDGRTGRTFTTPVKQFSAIFMNPEPHPDRAYKDPALAAAGSERHYGISDQGSRREKNEIGNEIEQMNRG